MPYKLNKKICPKTKTIYHDINGYFYYPVVLKNGINSSIYCSPDPSADYDDYNIVNDYEVYTE
jgi:hypothetical protein